MSVPLTLPGIRRRSPTPSEPSRVRDLNAWHRLHFSVTAFALAFIFTLAGVSIAAFILSSPLLLLIFALVGDAALVVAALRLRKTGNSVDDPLSAPAPRRR